MATGPRCCRRRTARWVTELPRGCFSGHGVCRSEITLPPLPDLFVPLVNSGLSDQQCTCGSVFFFIHHRLPRPPLDASSSIGSLGLFGSFGVAAGIAAPQRCRSMSGVEFGPRRSTCCAYSASGRWTQKQSGHCVYRNIQDSSDSNGQHICSCMRECTLSVACTWSG